MQHEPHLLCLVCSISRAQSLLSESARQEIKTQIREEHQKNKTPEAENRKKKDPTQPNPTDPNQAPQETKEPCDETHNNEHIQSSPSELKPTRKKKRAPTLPPSLPDPFSLSRPPPLLNAWRRGFRGRCKPASRGKRGLPNPT